MKKYVASSQGFLKDLLHHYPGLVLKEALQVISNSQLQHLSSSLLRQVSFLQRAVPALRIY